MSQESVIATCLVRAIQYLGERNAEEYTPEDDIKIVEETAYLLREATEEERRQLGEAARTLGYPDWMGHIGLE